MNIVTSRRQFLMKGGVVVAASAFARAGLPGAEPKEAEGDKEEDVSPAEDLMRVHGVLKRVLLIYGEAIRRLEANEACRRKRSWIRRRSSAISLRIITRSSKRTFFSRASRKRANLSILSI